MAKTPVYTDPANQVQAATAVMLVDLSGNYVAPSGGGGGAGDASAANQVIQSTKLDTLHADLIAATPAGSAIIGKVGIDQTTGQNVIAVSDGGNVTQGAKADVAYTGGVGSFSVIALLKGIYNACIAAIPAGTAIIGKVGIDQTTPGTTNGVVVNASALPTGAASAANQTTLIAQTKSLTQAATSTSSNVTAAAANTLVLAGNTGRLGGAIVNDSTSVLYLKLSAAASATSYDYYLAGSASGVPAQYEIPANYVGPVYGFWASANGAARVSERTQ